MTTVAIFAFTAWAWTHTDAEVKRLGKMLGGTIVGYGVLSFVAGFFDGMGVL